VFKRSIVRLSFLFVLVLISINRIFAQTTMSVQDGTLIDIEMQKIQEDFTKTEDADKSIPPSKLIEELNKPGNEHLLEQLKNGEFLNDQKIMDADLNKLKDEFKDSELDKESDEEKKKRLIALDEEEKLQFSSSDEMYFNREVYFNSIRNFYGYKIFIQNPDNENEDKNKAEPYLYSPRNTNHVIGPGDHFVLTLWGETEFQRQLTVSSEGTVYLDNVGVISVHGLTIVEFESRLKTLLSRKFSTIDPPNGSPSTFFDVYFDKLNVVNIYVTGEVVAQGPYQVNPNSTILTALIRAGGVTSKGTLRNIQVIRNGKTEIVFDVYDYLHTGKDVSEIVLKNGDNIFVSTRLNTIELKGEVYNPLKYELKPNETLADLIRYSGGLLASASIDNLTIERLVPLEETNDPRRVFKHFERMLVIQDLK
jgi:protein involved in polysaccharide export with SLBB domain